MNNIFHEDVRDFIESLNKHKVEYLVIGGYAVGFYGFLRATGDIDFWINPTKENAEKIIKAAIEYGISEENLNVEMFLSDERIVKIGEYPMKMEVLNKVSGLNFVECFERRRKGVMDGLEVNMLDFNDLVINKMMSNRGKDKIDLENIKDKRDPNKT